MAAAPPISYAAVHEKKQEDKALRVVKLEGSVVLKIVKHCQESQPSLVTGQLLGLDIGSSLEVTDCFPFPVNSAFCEQNSCCKEGAHIHHCAESWACRAQAGRMRTT